MATEARTHVNDTRIQEEVLKELRWDPRVEETDIGVIVHHGVVTLTGSVTSFAKRHAAQAAAHRVRGVYDVANDIEVRLPGGLARTDPEIAEAVRRALEWNVLVPEDRIQSTVTHGLVTLEGTVEVPHQREDAEVAVRHLLGVRGVDNRIAVSREADPASVRAEIAGALERRAERTLKHLEITVQNGRVRLDGPVHNYSEREAIVGAARFTPGVHAVDDRLYIDWYS